MDRLDKRVSSLRNHFSQAEKDIDLIETSSRKIQSKAETIEKIQLEDTDAMEDVIEPKQAPQIKSLID
jgi:DNA anti-recombination protein RmuC